MVKGYPDYGIGATERVVTTEPMSTTTQGGWKLARRVPGYGYSYTIDLGTAHSADTLVDFDTISPNIPAVWMTVVSLDGNVDLTPIGMDLNPLLTLSLTPLTYPQMVTIDDIAIRRLKVTNTAQTGKTCKLMFGRLAVGYIDYP